MLTLMEHTPVKKVYEGSGYKVIAKRMFEEVPIITIENIGEKRFTHPSFETDGKELIITYNNMQPEFVDKNNPFEWMKDVSQFIEDFYNQINDIKTF